MTYYHSVWSGTRCRPNGA